MRQALDLEITAKGYDPEFDELIPALFDTIIPRLLRPLESDGRSGNPLSSMLVSFYAHNEYEFGQWRPVCNRFGDEYVQAYFKNVQVSAPEEDYDGRVDLYKLKFNTHVSALFFDNPTLREQMLGDLRDLKARYG
ncbi:unnamed protein product [Cercospora beticola]|nr:unnamed protein product [Cercospora beticola]